MTENSTYNVYKQISGSDDFHYKLLHVPPELMKCLNSAEKTTLKIKAPDNSANEMVLCTEEKTWKIRQMNHSNTVYLMNEKPSKSLINIGKAEETNSPVNSGNLVGFSSQTYEYELSQYKGQLNLVGLPLYDGSSIYGNEKELISEQDLLENSPISEKEFYSQWYKMCGCTINNVAVILTESFTNEVLSTLIKYILSNGIDYKSNNFNIEASKVESWMKEISPKYTSHVTKTILNKFAQVSDDPLYRINNLLVSRWFGIQTLRENNGTPVTINEILLRWKSKLPRFFNVPIDIIHLRGYYFSTDSNHIQYFDPSKLDKNDISVRIKELFQINKEWDLEEFVSYIQVFIPSNKHPEKIILKYAKRKRVGKNKFRVIPK